jgi:hypothetical protein
MRPRCASIQSVVLAVEGSLARDAEGSLALDAEGSLPLDAEGSLPLDARGAGSCMRARSAEPARGARSRLGSWCARRSARSTITPLAPAPRAVRTARR